MWGFFLGVIFVTGIIVAFGAGTFFGWKMSQSEIDRDKTKWDYR